MIKLRNRSMQTIGLVIKGQSYTLPPGHSMEVTSLTLIENLPEIRKDIVIGQDLSEVVGDIGTSFRK